MSGTLHGRTAAVISEFPRAPRCCALAEAGAALRISGRITRRGGQAAVEAWFGSYQQAARLRALIESALGYRPLIQVLTSSNWVRGYGSLRPRAGEDPRYLLIAGAAETAEMLITAAGLRGPGGEPLTGMPPAVIAGGPCEWRAGWRGAFLAAGALTDPVRHLRARLTVECPNRDVAMALTGMARRVGVAARVRAPRAGSIMACVDDQDAIVTLLTRIGAPGAAEEWLARREERARQAARQPQAVPALGSANADRAREAAVRMTARARQALAILGDDVPGELAAAAQLRMQDPEASLSRLAGMCDPPVTKHTIAGRLRRLERMASETARRRGAGRAVTAAAG